MGAIPFGVLSKGTSASDAFNKAQEDAFFEYGHGGYTGTIAEKSGFKELKFSGNLNEFIDETIGDNDKWDDAFCVEVGEDEYYFYGWAST